MKAHASSILTSGNIVVAASGVDHKAFVEDVGKYFASIPEGAAPAKEKANYIGGQYSVPADSADGLPAALRRWLEGMEGRELRELESVSFELQERVLERG